MTRFTPEMLLEVLIAQADRAGRVLCNKSRLADQLGCSRPTLYTLWRHLENTGQIRRLARRRSRVCVYQVVAGIAQAEVEPCGSSPIATTTANQRLPTMSAPA